jgi:hypothetical protein
MPINNVPPLVLAKETSVLAIFSSLERVFLNSTLVFSPERMVSLSDSAIAASEGFTKVSSFPKDSSFQFYIFVTEFRDLQEIFFPHKTIPKLSKSKWMWSDFGWLLFTVSRLNL